MVLGSLAEDDSGFCESEIAADHNQSSVLPNTQFKSNVGRRPNIFVTPRLLKLSAHTSLALPTLCVVNESQHLTLTPIVLVRQKSALNVVDSSIYRCSLPIGPMQYTKRKCI
jgi:hypothetical protein